MTEEVKNEDSKLQAGLTVDKEKGLIIMDFGMAITWLSMSKEEAIVMGNKLIAKANEL